MLIVLVLQSIGFNKYIFIIINRYTNVLYKLQTMASGLAANTTAAIQFQKCTSIMMVEVLTVIVMPCSRGGRGCSGSHILVTS